MKAAIEFISKQGNGQDLKSRLIEAFNNIASHERKLGQKLYEGLKNIKNIHIVGPDYNEDQRSPTFSFWHTQYSSGLLCKKLAEENICAWSGHFYAIKASEVLGLEEKGGVTRMGMSAYTNDDDIMRTLSFMNQL